MTCDRNVRVIRTVSEDDTLQAIVADVGRTTVRIGLTDDRGLLRQDSVRDYDPATHSTLSSAMTSFGRDSGLRKLPRRCAIAVSGVPRGDTISITNSRWILSKSGLASMLQAEPLVINDFAANAWAMSSERSSGRVEPLTGGAVRPHQPGVYCIIGVGSGLGVAILSRDEHGIVSVIPTEGGHSHLAFGVAGAGPILGAVAGTNDYLTAETLISGPGLLTILDAVGKVRGRPVPSRDLAALLGGGSLRHDPVVVEAITILGQALWQFAGNMALAHGAWDGVILTGSVAAALRPTLRRPDLIDKFALPGPFTKRLRDVPRSTVSFRYAELEGAAIALLMEDARRGIRGDGYTLAA
jgi:glucokinase